jgi:hypothetical protein
MGAVQCLLTFGKELERNLAVAAAHKKRASFPTDTARHTSTSTHIHLFFTIKKQGGRGAKGTEKKDKEKETHESEF